MPRCGRSQERSKDHVPSIVLTWISQKPSPSSARVFAPCVANSLVPIAPGRQAGVDVVLVGVNASALGDGGLDDRPNRLLLDIGQQARDHLPSALDQAEDRWLLLRQRAAARRSRQPAASEPPLLATAAGCPLCPDRQ